MGDRYFLEKRFSCVFARCTSKRRQRHEDQELKVILGYIAKFKASLNTCNLSKTKQNENVKSQRSDGKV